MHIPIKRNGFLLQVNSVLRYMFLWFTKNQVWVKNGPVYVMFTRFGKAALLYRLQGNAFKTAEKPR